MSDYLKPIQAGYNSTDFSKLVNWVRSKINEFTGAVDKDGLNLKIVNRSLNMPNNDETRNFNAQLSKDVDRLAAKKKTNQEIENYINTAFDLKMGKAVNSNDLNNYDACKKLLSSNP